MGPRELFVYGTLIHGAPDPTVREAMDRYALMGPRAWVRGELLDLGPYPGAIPATRSDSRIEGRIVTLLQPKRLLPLLDDYEGATPHRPEAGLYRREVVRARPGKGPPRPVWIYWLNRVPRNAVRLPDGRWPA
ncbi:gamma-glutamylcyclotransferase family protein [Alkalilimnicola ehrlichii MLHE-1]|uniref:Gamma-glutamylcyclotransferase AIG2-like domain-containing protein n=1 Tax=Alkalilimnicola ehrlichii (strain ATCC BAA-1101 / DSM 17681 / MLHE-1) TaxID=187272 RepID=Q0ABY0_ALKEH|nr:gamma-glutamylcyclotransferase family protein [Alkalilimnicola ehrlichii]ABI55657.1 conserved hypothetical protein [Alkalilimnicola ehrlichii MLHE-1]